MDGAEAGLSSGPERTSRVREDPDDNPATAPGAKRPRPPLVEGVDRLPDPFHALLDDVHRCRKGKPQMPLCAELAAGHRGHVEIFKEYIGPLGHRGHLLPLVRPAHKALERGEDIESPLGVKAAHPFHTGEPRNTHVPSLHELPDHKADEVLRPVQGRYRRLLRY